MKIIIFYVGLFVFAISTAHARQYSGELVPSNSLVKKTVIDWLETIFYDYGHKINNVKVYKENRNGLYHFYVFADSIDNRNVKEYVNKIYTARRLEDGGWVLVRENNQVFWPIVE
jgi:hypothetical protein